MPRVKPDSIRKRCAHACDNCKRRKEKCDSQQPCSICIKRRADCRFSDVPASEIRKATSESRQPSASDALDNALQPLRADFAAHWGASTSRDDVPSEAPVPRSARLLQDARGSFIYFGDSASLSFLQNVRRVTSSILGACPFTTDRLRNSVLEDDPGTVHPPSNVCTPAASTPAFSTPTASHGPTGSTANRNADMLNASPAAPLPSFEHAEALANGYIMASSGRLNLFSTPNLMESLASWTADPNTYANGIHECLLNLVLAIGAQASQDLDDNAIAEDYFRVGRRQALLLFTEEPSLETVQSHALIVSYLLSACRRNAAFMTLGIAIRASHALGLHRADVQTLFSPAQKLQRKRAWNAIRVLDLFSSASMGRPSATSDFGTDYLYESSIKKEGLSDTEKYTLANQQLCRILEMILAKVYKNRTVSTRVADDISKEYRAWSASLPQVPLSLDDEPTDPLYVRAVRKLASTHLMVAYHWSIILLARPFLVFSVSLRRRRQNDSHAAALRASVSCSSVSTLADAAIDSSIKSLDRIEGVMKLPLYPRRMPFLLNSVFNSALAIGVAFFGDYDRSFPLAEGLEKALKILHVLAPRDPSAARYYDIIRLLADAVHEFVRKRDRSFMKQHSQRIADMFGQVAADGGPESSLRPPFSNNLTDLEGLGGRSSNTSTPQSGVWSADTAKQPSSNDSNTYMPSPTGEAHRREPPRNEPPRNEAPPSEATRPEGTHPTLTTTGLLLSINASDTNADLNPDTFMSNTTLSDYPYDPLHLSESSEEAMMQNHMNLFNPMEDAEYFEEV